MDKKVIFGSLWRTFEKFGKNTGGASAVIIALLAIPIFGFVGLSVDMGRAYVLKSKLATALDAAGLAAGRNIFAPDAEIYADAQKYFDANFPSGYMGTAPITMNGSNITWDTKKEKITLKVHADMNTTFMNVLGFPELTVGANTEIKRDNRGMELALVLDNTGSMTSTLGTSTRIGVLKTAAKNLIDILYGSDETKDKLWVSVVPYTIAVNVGPQNINFLSNSDRDNILSNSTSIFTDDPTDTALGRDVNGDYTNDTTYGWQGCVEMRDNLINGTKDVSDDPPAHDFVPFFSHDDSSNNWIQTKYDWKTGTYKTTINITSTRGPNKYCPPVLLPLTAEKTTIKTEIDSMVASGNTAVNIGMVWGWRTISPRWNGLWYGSSTLNLPNNTKVTPSVPYTALPLNYDEQNMDKVVILMTDGQNTIGSSNVYNAFGRQKLYGTSQSSSSYWDNKGFLNPYLPNDGDTYPVKADKKLLSVCTAMKAAGITIYTILLVDGNSSLLRDCATSPKYAFVATTADELLAHFNTIGEELSNLRISK